MPEEEHPGAAVDRIRLQTDLANRLMEHVGDKLCHEFVGLKWSDNMPADDPYAEFLVVDRDGTEWILEIDVRLWKPATPTAQDIGDTHQRL